MAEDQAKTTDAGTEVAKGDEQKPGCVAMLSSLILLIVGLSIAIPPLLNIVSRGQAILTAPFEIETQQISAILPGVAWLRTDNGMSGDWNDGWAYVDITNNTDGSVRDIRIEFKHRNERQVVEAFSAIARIADCANINADRKSRSTRIFDWLSDSFGGYAPVSPRSFGAVRVTIERWRTDVTVVTLHE